jgi:NADH-quinone oxidoreductase subunit C
MSEQNLVTRIQDKFGEQILAVHLDAIDPWVEVSADGLLEVCRYLHDEPDLKFDYLSCISGVDYFEADPKKIAKQEGKPRLEVVYHLWSVTHKSSLVLKVILPRWKDGQEGCLPEVPSVTDIWRTADWHEREVYDLSGVHFVGHPDLRRILCPEDWEGHPLRRDYQMPLEYHGIRCR